MNGLQKTNTSLPDLAASELKRQIEKLGTASAVSEKSGVHRSVISGILKGRRIASENDAEKLGLMRITFFVKKSDAPRVTSILTEMLNENARLQKILDKVIEK